MKILVSVTLFLCVFYGDIVSAVEPSKFVHIEKGDLPIIISAPHGGNLDIPDVDARKGEGLKTGGAGYVVARDTGTEELAVEVAAAVRRVFGRKPYLVAARSHRKYVDMNRPPEIAFEDTDAKPVYEAYHGALREFCGAVQKEFHKGLLVDLHGQSSSKQTVYRGTHDGKTVTLLRERYGDAAHSGELSLFGQLKSLGWTVFPDPLDGPEQSGFRGGYIVQTYGSHQGYGIDAMQLEFGADYRNVNAREKTAATLATAMVDYAERYLDVKIPVRELPETEPIEVGVFQGPGTGQSRQKMLNALALDRSLKVREISVEEIQAGKLGEFKVLVHPGGSGSAQGKALGEAGREKVRDFVAGGGGFVGVCAGAYLASADYDWSLHILDARVIDRQHWNRGFGNVELGMSKTGKEFFQSDRDRMTIYYHQGPLLAPANRPDIEDYSELAQFETEITENGTPPNVMRGTTAIAAGNYKKGRVLCISPHPESTKGEELLLLRGLRWTAKR